MKEGVVKSSEAVSRSRHLRSYVTSLLVYRKTFKQAHCLTNISKVSLAATSTPPLVIVSSRLSFSTLFLYTAAHYNL